MSLLHQHKRLKPYPAKPSNSNNTNGTLAVNHQNFHNYQLTSLNRHPLQLIHRQPEISLIHKVEFANKILNQSQSTVTPASNNSPNQEIVLNSVQLINFIDFYFNDLSHVSSTDNNLIDHQTCNDTEPNSNNGNSLITICFPCSACSTKFSFEQTFQLHLNRRSVLIRIYCIKCGTFKTFFNKCKLFYHIYSHKHNLYDPIYKNIQIDLVPAEKLNLNKEKTLVDLNMLFANLDKLMSDATNDEISIENGQPQLSHQMFNGTSEMNSMLLNTRFKVNNNDMLDIRKFLKCLLSNKFTVFKCGICDALFFYVEELRQHFHHTLNYELGLIQMQSGTNKKMNAAVLFRNQFKILKHRIALNNLNSNARVNGSVGEKLNSSLKLTNNNLKLNMTDDSLNQ
jgi:hypothetical protein